MIGLTVDWPSGGLSLLLCAWLMVYIQGYGWSLGGRSLGLLATPLTRRWRKNGVALGINFLADANSWARSVSDVSPLLLFPFRPERRISRRPYMWNALNCTSGPSIPPYTMEAA